MVIGNGIKLSSPDLTAWAKFEKTLNGRDY